VKKILALVLARKNSKRLKNKNILTLSGKPLILWTFDILKKKNIRKLFTDIIISTDSTTIKNLSKKYGFLSPWVRPKKLSNATASSESGAIHALNLYEKKIQSVDAIFLFQPTSPFRSQKNIILATNLYKKRNKQIVSVCSKKTYKFNVGDINGSLYLTPTNILKKYKNFKKKGFIKINMPKFSDNIDIDSIQDMNIAKSFRK
jgi:CMP-N-acetylneuraminic acid synthetase